ncbi:hypothetical protein GCM10010321_72340 [Streptomyces chartreusis]|nr:hypothetical protein GCM10010321_72340 [Streptomyces chartreusis]
MTLSATGPTSAIVRRISTASGEAGWAGAGRWDGTCSCWAGGAKEPGCEGDGGCAVEVGAATGPDASKALKDDVWGRAGAAWAVAYGG